jgi:hypothetical protein
MTRVVQLALQVSFLKPASLFFLSGKVKAILLSKKKGGVNIVENFKKSNC